MKSIDKPDFFVKTNILYDTIVIAKQPMKAFKENDNIVGILA